MLALVSWPVLLRDLGRLRCPAYPDARGPLGFCSLSGKRIPVAAPRGRSMLLAIGAYGEKGASRWSGIPRTFIVLVSQSRFGVAMPW